MLTSALISRKYSLLLSLLILTATLFSCSRHQESPDNAIRYVEKMLTDSMSVLTTLSANDHGANGSIVLIGDPVSCLKTSEAFMNSDTFDNIDGKAVPDGLPDFAGEVITSCLDFANAPYDSYLTSEDGKIFLREITVRNALASLDTACYYNPFDKTKKISKPSAKVILLCSPILATYGGDDVSDLFEQIGCDVPVVYSTDTTFSFTESCYKILRERNLFTHIIASPIAASSMTIPETNLNQSAYSPDGSFTEEFKYSRPSGAMKSTFLTISFNERYVPTSFPDTLGVLAPKSFASYVQNQY